MSNESIFSKIKKKQQKNPHVPFHWCLPSKGSRLSVGFIRVYVYIFSSYFPGLGLRMYRQNLLLIYFRYICLSILLSLIKWNDYSFVFYFVMYNLWGFLTAADLTIPDAFFFFTFQTKVCMLRLYPSVILTKYNLTMLNFWWLALGLIIP